MNQEDSLQFVQDRLRANNGSPLDREVHLGPRARVMRRFAVELERGSTRVFERVDGSVMVRCASGSLWITHDGDPKDVILSPEESYRAERDAAMHLFALQPCVLEIEFEDEVLVQQ
ncbi:MAG: hypothetical protein JWP41_2617 [Ramlibacter sp.]|nr:hypothetical protein [Ramlibacter sp.]